MPRNLSVEISCYACRATLTYCSTVSEYQFFILLFFVGNSSLDAHDGGTTAPWVWPSCQSLIGGIQDAFEGIFFCSLLVCFIFGFMLFLLYGCEHPLY